MKQLLTLRWACVLGRWNCQLCAFFLYHSFLFQFITVNDLSIHPSFFLSLFKALIKANICRLIQILCISVISVIEKSIWVHIQSSIANILDHLQWSDIVFLICSHHTPFLQPSSLFCCLHLHRSRFTISLLCLHPLPSFFRHFNTMPSVDRLFSACASGNYLTAYFLIHRSGCEETRLRIRKLRWHLQKFLNILSVWLTVIHMYTHIATYTNEIMQTSQCGLMGRAFYEKAQSWMRCIM